MSWIIGSAVAVGLLASWLGKGSSSASSSINSTSDDDSTSNRNLFDDDSLSSTSAFSDSITDSSPSISITGGRNSIGVYLGFAMTLYGRPQDRLSQVMVADEFLSNHDFYYPPPKAEVLIGKDNHPISTANACILLSEIPLVTLRHGLPENLISGEATYMATVEAAKRSFAPANLRVDYSKRSLHCGDQEVVLPPQHFAWYAWMARRRLLCSDYGGHVGWRDKDIGSEFLQEYQHVIGYMAHGYEETAINLAEGMTKEFFDEKKSRVNRLLREKLGLGASPYLIQSSGKRPTQRFGLSIPITSIFVTSRGTAS